MAPSNLAAARPRTSGAREPRAFVLAVLAACAAIRALSPQAPSQGPPAPPREPEIRSVIVQAGDLAAAAAGVRRVGGEITHRLGIVDAVAAELTRRQLAELERLGGGLRAYPQAWSSGLTESLGINLWVDEE